MQAEQLPPGFKALDAQEGPAHRHGRGTARRGAAQATRPQRSSSTACQSAAGRWMTTRARCSKLLERMKSGGVGESDERRPHWPAREVEAAALPGVRSRFSDRRVVRVKAWREGRGGGRGDEGRFHRAQA